MKPELRYIHSAAWVKVLPRRLGPIWAFHTLKPQPLMYDLSQRRPAATRRRLSVLDTLAVLSRLAAHRSNAIHV